MRKLTTAVALCAAATMGLLAACTTDGTQTAAADQEGGEGRIALLMPDTVLARWEQQDRPVFTETVEELCAECDVTTYNAGGDAAEQQRQAEAAIANGADVMVITAVDTAAAHTIVDLTEEAGVTLISYGRIIPHEGVDFGITTDPTIIGEQQAQSLLDELQARGAESGGLIVLNGSPTDSAAPLYKQGVHNVLDGSGYDIVAEYDTPNWDPMEAQRQMEQAISAEGQDGFVGVYAGNDGLAAGVIAAMQGAGIDPADVPVTGQDSEVAALQRIVVGTQFNTIYQPIRDFAAKAAELAVAMSLGEGEPEGLINGTTPTEVGDIPAYLYENQVITVDNIAETVIADGFVTVEEICTSEYESACDDAGLLD